MISPSQFGYYRSAVDELLDIMERGCRRFSSTGVLIADESEVRPSPLSLEAKARIVELFNQSMALDAIAREMGVHRNTVLKHTRSLRRVRR